MGGCVPDHLTCGCERLVPTLQGRQTGLPALVDADLLGVDGADLQMSGADGVAQWAGQLLLLESVRFRHVGHRFRRFHIAQQLTHCHVLSIRINTISWRFHFKFSSTSTWDFIRRNFKLRMFGQAEGPCGRPLYTNTKNPKSITGSKTMIQLVWPMNWTNHLLSINQPQKVALQTFCLAFHKTWGQSINFGGACSYNQPLLSAFGAADKSFRRIFPPLLHLKVWLLQLKLTTRCNRLLLLDRKCLIFTRISRHSTSFGSFQDALSLIFLVCCHLIERSTANGR